MKKKKVIAYVVVGVMAGIGEIVSQWLTEKVLEKEAEKRLSEDTDKPATKI